MRPKQPYLSTDPIFHLLLAPFLSRAMYFTPQP